MGMARESVYESLLSEQRAGKRNHVTLRTYLGKMHEIKLRAWEAHVTFCEMNQKYLRGEITDMEMEQIFRDAYSRGELPGEFIKGRGGRTAWLEEQKKRKRAANDVSF
jgi:hypothetical protein